MEQKTLLFTDQKIKEMIIPLFLEQLLLFSVGFSVVIMLFVLVGNRGNPGNIFAGRNFTEL